MHTMTTGQWIGQWSLFDWFVLCQKRLSQIQESKKTFTGTGVKKGLSHVQESRNI